MRYSSAWDKHSRFGTVPMLVLLLIGSFPVGAGDTVDRVAAVVNDEIITRSEVSIAFHLQEKKVMAPNPEEMKAVLEQLINRELAFQEIRRFEQIQADKSEILGALEDFRRRLPPEDLKEIMAANGMTEEELKVIFLKKTIIEKFCDERFLPFIQVSPGEIEAYYNNVFLPGFKKEGAADPPGFEAVSDRIRKRLEEEKFNQSVLEWTERLKRRANIIRLLQAP